MFSGGTNNSGTGGASLFGANNSQPTGANAGGTQNPPAQGNGGSLFGNKGVNSTSQNTGGSLFGSGNTPPAQAQGQGSSLFGAKPAEPKPQGGGLFGGAGQTSNPSQTNAPAPAQGSGLFNNGGGASQPTKIAGQGTSLFGGGGNTSNEKKDENNPAPANGGSLFGGAPKNDAPTKNEAGNGGSLFGNKTDSNTAKPEDKADNKGGSSLFGGGAAKTQGGSSMFSNNAGANNNAQPQNGNTTTTQIEPTDAEKLAANDQNSLMNKYIDQLFLEWKEGLDSQVEEFQSVALHIRENERDLVNTHNILKNIYNTYNLVNVEYKTLEDNITKIDRDHDIIESNLDIIESTLTSFTARQSPESYSRLDILGKCVDVNTLLTGADLEIGKLIERIGVTEETSSNNNLQVNTNTVLYSYYEMLRKLEMQTLHLRKQLDSLANTH